MMISLEMYLNGNLLDSATLDPSLLRASYEKYARQLIAELSKKHAALLSASAQSPAFILGSLPSSLNEFVPLRHRK